MKLSKKMNEALLYIRSNDGVVRYSGGFWAAGDEAQVERGGLKIPKVHFSTRTIEGLEKRGLIAPTEWRYIENLDIQVPIRFEPL